MACLLRRLMRKIPMPSAEAIAIVGAFVLAGLAFVADFAEWLSKP